MSQQNQLFNALANLQAASARANSLSNLPPPDDGDDDDDLPPPPPGGLDDEPPPPPSVVPISPQFQQSPPTPQKVPTLQPVTSLSPVGPAAPGYQPGQGFSRPTPQTTMTPQFTQVPSTPNLSLNPAPPQPYQPLSTPNTTTISYNHRPSQSLTQLNKFNVPTMPAFPSAVTPTPQTPASSNHPTTTPISTPTPMQPLTSTPMAPATPSASTPRVGAYQPLHQRRIPGQSVQQPQNSALDAQNAQLLAMSNSIPSTPTPHSQSQQQLFQQQPQQTQPQPQTQPQSNPALPQHLQNQTNVQSPQNIQKPTSTLSLGNPTTFTANSGGLMGDPSDSENDEEAPLPLSSLTSQQSSTSPFQPSSFPNHYQPATPRTPMSAKHPQIQLSEAELQQLQQTQNELGNSSQYNATQLGSLRGQRLANQASLPPLQAKTSKFAPFSPRATNPSLNSNPENNVQNDPHAAPEKQLSVRKDNAAYAFAHHVQQPTYDMSTMRPLAVRGAVYDPNANNPHQQQQQPPANPALSVPLDQIPSTPQNQLPQPRYGVPLSANTNSSNVNGIPASPAHSTQMSFELNTPSALVASRGSANHPKFTFDIADDEELEVDRNTFRGAIDLKDNHADRITRTQAKESTKQRIIQQQTQLQSNRGGFEEAEPSEDESAFQQQVNPLSQGGASVAVAISTNQDFSAQQGKTVRESKKDIAKSKILGLFSRGKDDNSKFSEDFPDEMMFGRDTSMLTDGSFVSRDNTGLLDPNDMQHSQAVIQTNALLTPLHNPTHMTFLISKPGKGKGKKMWLYQCRHRFKLYWTNESDRKVNDKKHNIQHIRNIRGGIRGCGSSRCANFVYSDFSRLLKDAVDDGCHCERFCQICEKCVADYSSVHVSDILKIVLGNGSDSACTEKGVFARNDCTVVQRDGTRHHWCFPDTYSRNLFVGQCYYLIFANIHINAMHHRNVLVQEKARYSPQNDTISGDWTLVYNGKELDIDDDKYPLRKQIADKYSTPAKSSALVAQTVSGLPMALASPQNSGAGAFGPSNVHGSSEPDCPPPPPDASDDITSTPPASASIDLNLDVAKNTSKSYPAPIISVKPTSALFNTLLQLSFDNLSAFTHHYTYINEVTQSPQYAGGLDLASIFEYITASRVFDLLGINMFDSYKRFHFFPYLHDLPTYISTFEAPLDHLSTLKLLHQKNLLQQHQQFMCQTASVSVPTTTSSSSNQPTLAPLMSPREAIGAGLNFNSMPGSLRDTRANEHLLTSPPSTSNPPPPPPPPPPSSLGAFSYTSPTNATNPTFPIPNPIQPSPSAISTALSNQSIPPRTRGGGPTANTFFPPPAALSIDTNPEDLQNTQKYDFTLTYGARPMITPLSITVPPFVSILQGTSENPPQPSPDAIRLQQQFMLFAYKNRADFTRIFPTQTRLLTLLYQNAFFFSLDVNICPPMYQQPTYPTSLLISGLKQSRFPLIPQLVGWPIPNLDGNKAHLKDADQSVQIGNTDTQVNLNTSRMLPSARRKQQQMLEEQQKQQKHQQNELRTIQGKFYTDSGDPNDNIPYGATSSVYGDFSFPSTLQYDFLPLVTTPPIYVPPALTIFTSTWNAGAKALPKPEVLKEWLGANHNGQIDGLRTQKKINQRFFQESLFTAGDNSNAQQGHGPLLTESVIGAVGSDIIVLAFQENKNIDVWITAVQKYLNDPQHQREAFERVNNANRDHMRKMHDLAVDKKVEILTAKRLPPDSTLAIAGVFPDVTIVNETVPVKKGKPGAKNVPTAAAEDDSDDDGDDDYDGDDLDAPPPPPPTSGDQKSEKGEKESKLFGLFAKKEKKDDKQPAPTATSTTTGVGLGGSALSEVPDLNAAHEKDRSAFEQQLLGTAGTTKPSAQLSYELVISKGFWEIAICVFVRSDKAHLVGERYVETVATGIGNVLGNKGAIGAYISIANTPMLFVCSHLEAREERCAQRNQNYTRIISELGNKLGPKLGLNLDLTNAPVVPALQPNRMVASACSSTSTSSLFVKDLFAHVDVVLWLGDLNYRNICSFDEAIGYCKANNLAPLAACDQLTFERLAWRSFIGFEEGPLDFTPTYRWNRGECSFSNKRAQPPSWTDRVLYKRATKDLLTLLSYGARHNIIISDHRPVVASFAFTPAGTNLVNTRPLASDQRDKQLASNTAFGTLRQLKEVTSNLTFSTTIQRPLVPYKLGERMPQLTNPPELKPLSQTNSYDVTACILQNCGCIGDCMCAERFMLPLRPHEQEIDDNVSKVITVTAPVFDIELVDFLLLPLSIVPLVKPVKDKKGVGGDDDKDGPNTPAKGAKDSSALNSKTDFPRSDSSLSETSVDNFVINEAHSGYHPINPVNMNAATPTNQAQLQRVSMISSPMTGSGQGFGASGTPPPPPPPPSSRPPSTVSSPSGAFTPFDPSQQPPSGVALSLGPTSAAPQPAVVFLQPSAAQQNRDKLLAEKSLVPHQQYSNSSVTSHLPDSSQVPPLQPTTITQSQILPTLSVNNVIEILELHSKSTKMPAALMIKALFPFFSAITPPQTLYQTPLSSFHSAQIINYNYFQQKDQEKSAKAAKHLALIFTHPFSNKLAISPPIIGANGFVQGNSLVVTTTSPAAGQALLPTTTPTPSSHIFNSSNPNTPHDDDPDSASQFGDFASNNPNTASTRLIGGASSQFPPPHHERSRSGTYQTHALNQVKSGQFSQFVPNTVTTTTSAQTFDQSNLDQTHDPLLQQSDSVIVTSTSISTAGAQQITFYPVGASSYIRTDCRDPIALAATSISVAITGTTSVKTNFSKKSSTEIIGYATIPLATAVRSYALSLNNTRNQHQNKRDPGVQIEPMLLPVISPTGAIIGIIKLGVKLVRSDRSELS